ncbi:MAG: ribosome-binding factor A [Alphaproteobacteria bacterium]
MLQIMPAASKQTSKMNPQNPFQVSPAARSAAAKNPRNFKNQRQQRVAALVHKTLTEVLAHPDALHEPEIASARLTITDIQLSQDLNLARVKVLPLAASAEGLDKQVAPEWNQSKINDLNQKLSKANHNIRRQLAQRIALKRIPKLELQFDQARMQSRKLENRLMHMAEMREQHSTPS